MSNKKPIRFGLFLGTFNPPHIGHLYSATYALNNNLCDKVIVCPAWQNPWKEVQWNDVKKSFNIRAEMCKIMFGPLENIIVSELDGEIQSNYSYEFLQKIIENFSDRKVELYIIGGTDVVEQIDKWKNANWIKNNFGFIKVPRPGYDDDFGDYPSVYCSSSQIRKMIENNINPMPFINKELHEYINKNFLY